MNQVECSENTVQSNKIDISKPKNKVNHNLSSKRDA